MRLFLVCGVCKNIQSILDKRVAPCREALFNLFAHCLLALTHSWPLSGKLGRATAFLYSLGPYSRAAPATATAAATGASSTAAGAALVLAEAGAGGAGHVGPPSARVSGVAFTSPLPSSELPLTHQ